MARTYFQDFEPFIRGAVTVEYSITAGSMPTWEEPGEAGEVEIVGVWLKDSEIPVTLTAEEDEKFSTWIAENHEYDDGPDDD